MKYWVLQQTRTRSVLCKFLFSRYLHTMRHLTGLLQLTTAVKARIEAYLLKQERLIIPPDYIITFKDRNGVVRVGRKNARFGFGSTVSTPKRTWCPCVLFDDEKHVVDRSNVISAYKPQKLGDCYARCMAYCCLAVTCNKYSLFFDKKEQKLISKIQFWHFLCNSIFLECFLFPFLENDNN